MALSGWLQASSLLNKSPALVLLEMHPSCPGNLAGIKNHPFPDCLLNKDSKIADLVHFLLKVPGLQFHLS
jgi:hypothetical protein